MKKLKWYEVSRAEFAGPQDQWTYCPVRATSADEALRKAGKSPYEQDAGRDMAAREIPPESLEGPVLDYFCLHEGEWVI